MGILRIWRSTTQPLIAGAVPQQPISLTGVVTAGPIMPPNPGALTAKLVLANLRPPVQELGNDRLEISGQPS